jgi:small basic protein (TIGR04137 family)
MPIDKSLKVKSGGIQNRNVLTRAERIEKLKELEKGKRDLYF